MEKKLHSISYTQYCSTDELPATEKNLLEYAIKATESSYAPYSNFNVGAAVLMSNGETVTGSNQENAASPSGLCAERVAIFAAHHKFPTDDIEAIAVIGKENGEITTTLTYPCAACLQVLTESQKRSGKAIKIIVGSATAINVFNSVDDLVPFSFMAHLFWK